MKSKEIVPMNKPVIGYRLADSVRTQFNNYIGKLLTQLDASLPENKQTDALKTIIKNEMWRLNDAVQKETYRYVSILETFEPDESIDQILERAEVEFGDSVGLSPIEI